MCWRRWMLRWICWIGIDRGSRGKEQNATRPTPRGRRTQQGSGNRRAARVVARSSAPIASVGCGPSSGARIFKIDDSGREPRPSTARKASARQLVSCKLRLADSSRASLPRKHRVIASTGGRPARVRARFRVHLRSVSQPDSPSRGGRRPIVPSQALATVQPAVDLPYPRSAWT